MSLTEITTRIAAAATRAGRAPDAVTLIAVSKVQPVARVRHVLEEGHRIFGENRVQEAVGKWPALRNDFTQDAPVELHLIGPLQSNKLGPALEHFDVIHSLDRERLARKLAEAVQARGACPGLFVQVNTGEEAQKSGIAPEALDAFVASCRATYDLTIQGLMAIPPIEADPVPHFLRLGKMAARNGLAGLSMGMSGDFEAAIEHGATHVRIGSAIFGARGSGDAVPAPA